MCIILLFIIANNAQDVPKKKTKVVWYPLSRLPKFDNSLPHTKTSHMFLLNRLEKGDGCRLAIKCQEASSSNAIVTTATGNSSLPQCNRRKRQTKPTITNEVGLISFTSALNNG